MRQTTPPKFPPFFIGRRGVQVVQCSTKRRQPARACPWNGDLFFFRARRPALFDMNPRRRHNS